MAIFNKFNNEKLNQFNNPPRKQKQLGPSEMSINKASTADSTTIFNIMMNACTPEA